MTLKAIESEFAKLLEQQMKEDLPLDLSLEGPLMNKLHPKILWSQLVAKFNPEQEPGEELVPGYWFECFPDTSAAIAKYPHLKSPFVGRPWSIYQFLTGSESHAIVDFKELGAVYLSKEELLVSRTNTIYNHVLPPWISYALSPELWGPQGKWTRFHERLLTLFNQHNLLDGKATLGYYPLVSKAEKLEILGFPGTRLEKNYLLVMPWTFSLQDLVKLERVIQQEF